MITLFFPLLLAAQDLAAERHLYGEAHKDEGASQRLTQLTADADTTRPTQMAYRAAALMVSAQFAKGVGTKLRLFREGKDLMVKAVKADPNNVEIHFLRMTVQENAPGILMYSDSLQQDKDFILGHFSSVKDPGLKKLIREHARVSDLYSEVEKAKLLPVR